MLLCFMLRRRILSGIRPFPVLAILIVLVVSGCHRGSSSSVTKIILQATGAQVGQMNAERWTTMYQQLIEIKVIDKQLDPATAYTLQFITAK